jgi:gliding motility-associated-like protein
MGNQRCYLTVILTVKRTLFAFLLLTQWSQLMATHIIGGNMYYDHLGGNQYRVTLVLYRDCGPDNANNTGFDNAAQLAVFNAAGAQVTSTSVQFSGEVPVPVVLEDPCLTAPPTVCVRTTVYQHVFNLPTIPGGYTISYQRCCRTPAMLNLNGLQGLTCTATIPGPPLNVNSSPRFSDLPAIALCVGQATTIDFSATDPDGDQLVYGLCAPYIGGTATDPAPFPSAPPYSTVTYDAGYSADQPVDSDPPMSIDPNTGQLTISPTLQGVFTVGVCVTEIRDGVVVGETRGDFLFKVVVCDVGVTALVAEQGSSELCAGLTQEFENESENATFWAWDFGDANTLADTSNAQEPVWTYAQPGIYTVRLIANPGEPCADTSFQVYDMQAPMDIFFERPPIRCVGQPAELFVSGVFGPSATFAWSAASEGSPAEGGGQSFTVVYTEVGIHPVTLSGVSGACADSYTDSVIVLPPPVIGLFNDPEACPDEGIAFASTSTGSTTLRYLWDVGDGTIYNDSAFQHTYSQAGVFPVSLTIRTDSGCIAERTLDSEVRIHPEPIAAFTVSPLEVSLLDPEVLVADRSQDAVDRSFSVEGLILTDSLFTYEFTDGGRRTITLTVTSPFGCIDTTSRVVTVSDHLLYIPNAFTPDGDGVNDTWSPSVRGARLYELTVFDRWGRVVFSTTDPSAGWSGAGEGEGMYNYVVRLAEYGAFRKEYRGHVSLLR